MPKISGMQAYAERYAQARLDAAQQMIMQYAVDTLQMALHQTEGWGYDRIMRLTEAWTATQREYRAAVNPSDPAADVMQEHMDRVIAQIINGRQELIPFASRYPGLQKIKYGRW